MNRENGRQYAVSHKNTHPHMKQPQDNQEAMGCQKLLNPDGNDSSNFSLREGWQERQNALSAIPRESPRQPHSQSGQGVVQMPSGSPQSGSQRVSNSEQGRQNLSIQNSPLQGGGSERAIPSNQL